MTISIYNLKVRTQCGALVSEIESVRRKTDRHCTKECLSLRLSQLVRVNPGHQLAYARHIAPTLPVPDEGDGERVPEDQALHPERRDPEDARDSF